MAMEQTHLMKSGVQFWSSQVVAAGEGRLAYASTLAVYIFTYDSLSLEQVITGMEKSIACIALSSGVEPILAVGNVAGSLDCFRLLPSGTSERLLTRARIGFVPDILTFSPTPKGGDLLAAGGKILAAYSSTSGSSSTIRSFDAQIESVSCNAKRPGFLAIASSGSVHLISAKRKHRKLTLHSDVHAAKFDPFSESYLLVALKDGRISLYDCDSKELLASFAKHAGLSHICWTPGIPGSFITVASRSTVLRLWNVSQHSPISQLRTNSPASNVTALSSIDNTSDVLVGFRNGAVGVFDINTSRAKWYFSGGHTETAFDCSICPADSNLLASTGYDATIKLWDLEELHMKADISGPQVPLFSVTWSLDGAALAASGNQGYVYVLDATDHVLKKTAQHHSDSVLKVEQHPTDSNLLLTSSRDGKACILDWNLQLVTTFKHNAKLFGSSWNPHESNTFATATEMGQVHLWNSQDPSKPIKTISREAKAFAIAWSPHAKRVMCVTYDDHTARVWNVEEEKCMELIGHENKVRGSIWHPEIPYLLFTGSWDNTIRTWDVRSGSCIHISSSHQGDVYSFSIHPQRPFRVVSCSRDTTLRIWSLQSFARASSFAASSGKLMCQKALRYTFDGLPDSDLLCGNWSQSLNHKWENATPLEKKEYATLFFSATSGMKRLFELLRLSADDESSSNVSTSLNTPILHMGESTELLGAHAAELECLKSKRAIGLGVSQREVSMRSAARLHLKLGNVDTYCQLMKSLGEWEHALAAAPAVGIEYWSKLMREWAEELEGKGKDASSTIDLRLLLGDADTAVRSLLSENAFDDAFTVAVCSHEGMYDHISFQSTSAETDKDRNLSQGKNKLDSLPTQTSHGSDTSRRKSMKALYGVREKQAEQFFHSGEPAYAACCLLSVRENWAAVAKLVFGWELCAAANVAELACGHEGSAFSLHIHFSLLEQAGLIELAMEHALAHEDWWRSQVLSARPEASATENEKLRKQALPVPESERVKDRSGALTALCDREYTHAAGLCNAELHTLLSDDSWTWDDVGPLAQMLCSLPVNSLDTLTLNKSAALLCYIGSLVAAWLGFQDAVQPLTEEAMRYKEQECVEFPISAALMSKQLDSARTTTSNTSVGDETSGRTGESSARTGHEIKKRFEGTELSEYKIHLLNGSHPPMPTGAPLPGSAKESKYAGLIAGAANEQKSEEAERILDQRLPKMTPSEVVMWTVTMPMTPFRM